MKSRFAPDSQNLFEGVSNPAWDDPNFWNFLPPARHNGESPFAAPPSAPTPALSNEAVEAEGAQAGPVSLVAETSGGGITINLLFDAAAMAAPASFRAGIEQAASILASTITNKITVNLKIDYSGTGGGAAAGPDNGLYESYTSVRTDLINSAAPGDTTFNALPSGSSIQGQSTVAVWNAQLKLFGLLGANDTTTDDGSATFATDINPNLLVGVALHELTHALGRVPYGSQPDIFDLFRFTSAGTRLFTDNIPATAAYFSLNGGNTKLADFGLASDPSDFLNSGVQGANDPFNEFYTSSTSQTLTTADKQILDALGFNTTTAVTATSEPNLRFVGEGDFTAGGGADLVWQNGGGADLWVSNGSTLTQVAVPGGSMGAEWTAYGVGDFNGDGNADLLWTNTSGQAAIWEMNGPNIVGVGVAAGKMGAEWHVAGIGDFKGDGDSDILWVSTSGQAAVWTMSGTTLASVAISNGSMGAEWHVVAIGDFNKDGRSDVLWESATGSLATWEMNGANLSGFIPNVGQIGAGWQVAGVGHFNGAADSTSDIVWLNSNTNHVQIWQMQNGKIADFINPSGLDGLEWHLEAIGNFAGDGNSDLLWISNSGAASIWEINGASVQAISVSAPAGATLQLSDSVTVSAAQQHATGTEGASLAGTETVTSGTIGAGATLELFKATSESVTFNGSTGTLIIDHSATFSGETFNFTGDGNLSSSDQIDLRDIAFGSGTVSAFTGNSSGGALTITDAQNHSANVLLAGNYTDSSFLLSGDGNGGTIVIDPPAVNSASGTLSFNETSPADIYTVSATPQDGGGGYLGGFTVGAVTSANGQELVGWHFNFDSSSVPRTVTQSYDVTVADNQANGTNSIVSQTIFVTVGGPGQDSFVFKPGVGTDVIANAKISDTIELDGFASVANINQLQTLLNDAQTGESQSLFQAANGGRDTVIDLGNHDSITLANVKIADLHASNFIIHV
jgi:hypothetical protein